MMRKSVGFSFSPLINRSRLGFATEAAQAIYQQTFLIFTVLWPWYQCTFLTVRQRFPYAAACTNGADTFACC